MNRFHCYFIFILIFVGLQTEASRALYVDGFASILGNNIAENELLHYAQTNGMETLLLYELHLVNANINMANPSTNGVLADFIYKAKTSYGITHMGGSAENADFFTNVIHAYNNSRTDPLEKFDIYNLEFEYWNPPLINNGAYYCTTYLNPNGIPCTNNGAFQFFVSIMQTMESLANNSSHPITIEAYVGWPTAGQADTIAEYLDRVRVHAYVNNPNTSFNYVENRLIDFANGHPGVDISLLFSTEPNFMQQWLENHSLVEAEQIFTEDWMNQSALWPSNINLEGFTYFTYSYMENIFLEADIIFRQNSLKINRLESDELLILKGLMEQYTIKMFDINGVLREELNTQGLTYLELNVKLPYEVHQLQCTNNSNGNIEAILLLSH